MSTSAIELCIRRPADVATLRRVADALRVLGLSCELRLLGEPAFETDATHAPNRLRVIVDDGTQPLEEQLIDGAELVAIWDSCVPLAYATASRPPLEACAQLRLVAVPGEAHVRELSLRLPAEIVATGLPRFDDVRHDLRQARAEARRRLGLSEHATVVTYTASEPERDLGGLGIAELAELCASGERTLLILPQRSWSEASLEKHRRVAAARAGVVLCGDDAAGAILAADVVVGDAATAIWEARALGIRTLLIETQAEASLPFELRVRDAAQLPAALRSALDASRPAEPFDLDSLRADGGAAARVAEAIRDALQRRPGSVALRSAEVFARLEAQAAFGDGAGAARELRTHLVSHPSAEGFALLASISRRCGDLEGAIVAAERAVELGCEGAARALCERARVDVERGELSRARSQFEDAERLCSTLADPWIGQGSLDLHAGEPARAEQRFRSALQLEKSSRAWSGLGLALAAQGRFRDALAPLEAALDVDPECQAALYGLVQAGFQTGELAVAAKRVERFVDVHPGNLHFTFTLAGLCHELGQRDAARGWMERIEMFDPAYPGLQELRSKLGA